MQRPDNLLQIRIKECEKPTFGYRRGEDSEIEKDVFDDEPLPDGWVDSPAKVDEPPTKDVGIKAIGLLSKSIRELVEDEGPGPFDSKIGDGRLMPPYEDHKFPILRAELKRRTSKGPPLGTTKKQAIKMLADLDILNQ